MRYYVIPDLHGRSDLLKTALITIYSRQETGKIIFLGDYINRGPDSVGVCLLAMSPKEGWEHICLMGNHEEMFLSGLSSRDFYDLDAATQILRSPHRYIIFNWMKNLRLYHTEGENLFVHAGADPLIPLEHQTSTDLRWARYSDFHAYTGKHYLVHGHTIRQHGPIKSPNRLNLDCGAYKYGKLIVGVFEEGTRGEVDFIEVK